MSAIIADTSMPLSGAAITMGRNLLARLNAAYPAFGPSEEVPEGFWRVAINEAGGMIQVINLFFRFQYVLHIDKLDPEGRKVVRAAGEMLERHGVSRSGVRSVVVDSLLNAKRDFRGHLVADHG